MSSFVPESYQKKLDRTKKEAEELKKARDVKRAALAQKRQEWAKKGQAYLEKEQKRQVEEVSKFRLAKSTGDFYIPPETRKNRTHEQ